MAKARVPTRRLKAGVHLLLANHSQTPLEQVVMEYTFVELMEDVRSDACKNVGEGKVLPKWFIDCA